MVKRALVFLAACSPDLVDDTSLIDEPRLLAARVEPAEVAPNSEVTTTALFVDPSGTLAEAPLEWAFCTARKRLSEPGTVASACLVDAAPELVVFGEGLTATGTLPSNGCQQFGPDAPAPAPGEPAGRPADPDGTGGFYQPIRIRAADEFVLGQVRLRCGLPGATAAQAAAFREGYVANANPAIEAFEADGAAIVDDAIIAAGSTLELVVRWPSCDTAPCAGSEPYLWFDPEARQLVDRREAMRVSWFASAGQFASGHSGRSEAELEPFATGAWTAPREPGPVTVWTVLRDDRGGVVWRTARFTVE